MEEKLWRGRCTDPRLTAAGYIGSHMRRIRLLAGVVFPFWLLACTHSQTVAANSPGSEVITEQEVASTTAATAYDIIRKRRPNFLSSRGKTSLLGTSNADPTVYVDDQAYGPISSLRTIPASQVSSIRLYRSWEATTKYGSGNMGGVIAVSTKQ
jgi:hypothetical protein